MKTYEVTLTGKTPLLMHRDNIDWAGEMKKWETDPKNKKESVPGDDRSPAFRWLGSLYYAGKEGVIGLPSDNIMRVLMEAGAGVSVGKGMKTFRGQTQSGMMTGEEIWPVVVDDHEVRFAELSHLRNEKDFDKHIEDVGALGFGLYVKRAIINGRTRHLRVRPRFDQWSCSGTLVVWDDALKPDILRSILHVAGEYKGVGDWRPSSKTPGPFGRFSFDLKQVKD